MLSLDSFFLYIEQEYGEVSARTLEVMVDTAYIWIPLAVLVLFWQSWVDYVRAAFIHKQGSVLLEIVAPREVTKTPQAMEVILNTLYLKGEPETFRHAFWDGKLPPWFSLEMYSEGGNVHFYIWAWRKHKNLIEQQFYAQYPGIEIHEVEDYTKSLFHDPSRFEMWGCQFALKNKNIYPIKTYVDYGLDKPQKEEEKTDPLTSVIEYLGNVEKNNKVMIQILIQAHSKKGVKFGNLIPKPDWKKEAEKEIEKIRKSVQKKQESGQFSFSATEPFTESEQDTVKLIKRSLSKHAFDTTIRAIYISERDNFNPGHISGLLATIQQYNVVGQNGFGLKWKTDFDYPWEDFKRTRELEKEKKLIDAYKRRSYFQGPHKYFKKQPFILTTEELATIFHVPGSVATTPTFPRVGSRKEEAPSNLPTE